LEGHFIKSVLGDLIILENGSVWESGLADYTKRWLGTIRLDPIAPGAVTACRVVPLATSEVRSDPPVFATFKGWIKKEGENDDPHGESEAVPEPLPLTSRSFCKSVLVLSKLVAAYSVAFGC
jgi:hypothetical protein